MSEAVLLPNAVSASGADDPVGSARRTERTAHSLRALGKSGLPREFTIDGVTYRRTLTVKHDFFAATGFYASDAGRKVVLKMGRTEDFAGFPLEWLGRGLCRGEMRFYAKLADLPNVPAVVGIVGPTGFVHDFVEGHPLCKERPVPDGFFANLEGMMRELHRRDIAYVDTNKPQNILLGDDGLPHLIDFQISWDLDGLVPEALARPILRMFQRADAYHILKHKRRLRPDEMTAEESARLDRKHFFIHVHRFLSKPYFLFRRRTFKRLRAAGRLMPEGSK